MKRIIAILIILPLVLSTACATQWDLITQGYLTNVESSQNSITLTIDNDVVVIHQRHDSYLAYDPPFHIGAYYYLYRAYSVGAVSYKLTQDPITVNPNDET